MMIKDVTLASNCYEKDYRLVLKTDFGKRLFGLYNKELFETRMLLVSNINDKNEFYSCLEESKIKCDIDYVYMCSDYEEELLNVYMISRDSFVYYVPFIKRVKSLLKNNRLKKEYDGYNYSISPMLAIEKCPTDYLLYITEDVHFDRNETFSWIESAKEKMVLHPEFFVANPIWNNNISECKKEAEYIIENWAVSSGFSDQCFLINVKRVREIRKDIYNEINKISNKKYMIYAGNCFEKRINAYMRNNKLNRIFNLDSSYFHEEVNEKTISEWM